MARMKLPTHRVDDSRPPAKINVHTLFQGGDVPSAPIPTATRRRSAGGSHIDIDTLLQHQIQYWIFYPHQHYPRPPMWYSQWEPAKRYYSSPSFPLAAFHQPSPTSIASPVTATQEGVECRAGDEKEHQLAERRAKKAAARRARKAARKAKEETLRKANEEAPRQPRAKAKADAPIAWERLDLFPPLQALNPSTPASDFATFKRPTPTKAGHSKFKGRARLLFKFAIPIIPRRQRFVTHMVNEKQTRDQIMEELEEGRSEAREEVKRKRGRLQAQGSKKAAMIRKPQKPQKSQKVQNSRKTNKETGQRAKGKVETKAEGRGRIGAEPMTKRQAEYWAKYWAKVEAKRRATEKRRLQDKKAARIITLIRIW
ncbi:hypothetical protein RSAG8_06918, partial [Rhizoctonia solani AG-8 WAC10335]